MNKMAVGILCQTKWGLGKEWEQWRIYGHISRTFIFLVIKILDFYFASTFLKLILLSFVIIK